VPSKTLDRGAINLEGGCFSTPSTPPKSACPWNSAVASSFTRVQKHRAAGCDYKLFALNISLQLTFLQGGQKNYLSSPVKSPSLKTKWALLPSRAINYVTLLCPKIMSSPHFTQAFAESWKRSIWASGRVDCGSNEVLKLLLRDYRREQDWWSSWGSYTGETWCRNLRCEAVGELYQLSQERAKIKMITPSIKFKICLLNSFIVQFPHPLINMSQKVSKFSCPSITVWLVQIHFKVHNFRYEPAGLCLVNVHSLGWMTVNPRYTLVPIVYSNAHSPCMSLDAVKDIFT